MSSFDLAILACLCSCVTVVAQGFYSEKMLSYWKTVDCDKFTSDNLKRVIHEIPPPTSREGLKVMEGFADYYRRLEVPQLSQESFVPSCRHLRGQALAFTSELRDRTTFEIDWFEQKVNGLALKFTNYDGTNRFFLANFAVSLMKKSERYPEEKTLDFLGRFGRDSVDNEHGIETLDLLGQFGMNSNQDIKVGMNSNQDIEVGMNSNQDIEVKKDQMVFINMFRSSAIALQKFHKSTGLLLLDVRPGNFISARSFEDVSKSPGEEFDLFLLDLKLSLFPEEFQRSKHIPVHRRIFPSLAPELRVYVTLSSATSPFIGIVTTSSPPAKKPGLATTSSPLAKKPVFASNSPIAPAATVYGRGFDMNLLYGDSLFIDGDGYIPSVLQMRKSSATTSSPPAKQRIDIATTSSAKKPRLATTSSPPANGPVFSNKAPITPAATVYGLGFYMNYLCDEERNSLHLFEHGNRYVPMKNRARFCEEGLVDIIKKCMETDPKKRYESPGVLAKALEERRLAMQQRNATPMPVHGGDNVATDLCL